MSRMVHRSRVAVAHTNLTPPGAVKQLPTRLGGRLVRFSCRRQQLRLPAGSEVPSLPRGRPGDRTGPAPLPLSRRRPAAPSPRHVHCAPCRRPSAGRPAAAAADWTGPPLALEPCLGRPVPPSRPQMAAGAFILAMLIFIRYRFHSQVMANYRR